MTTRKLGFSALLKAYYTRLTTHANTLAYTTYNHAPENASMPYITFGTPIGIKSPILTTMDIEGEENTVTVHVWGDPDSEGDKAVGDIMNNIIQALHSSALTITGYTDVMKAELEYSEILVDESEPGLPCRHGILRFTHTMA